MPNLPSIEAKEKSYDEYIRDIAKLRRDFRRGRFFESCERGSPHWLESFNNRPWLMPIELRAFDVARHFDGDKRRFGKIIAELAEHKAEPHPHMRRYLLERLRDGEKRHREIAERFGAAADQFEEKTVKTGPVTCPAAGPKRVTAPWTGSAT
jgi:hypothetical protein